MYLPNMSREQQKIMTTYAKHMNCTDKTNSHKDMNHTVKSKALRNYVIEHAS